MQTVPQIYNHCLENVWKTFRQYVVARYSEVWCALKSFFFNSSIVLDLSTASAVLHHIT